MYDACVCVDYDGEAASFYEEKIVKARKEHVCGECRCKIGKGDRYELVKGMWDGEFGRHKTCMPCRNAREDLFTCSFSFGMIWEDIRQTFLDTLPIGETDDMEWLL